MDDFALLEPPKKRVRVVAPPAARERAVSPARTDDGMMTMG